MLDPGSSKRPGGVGLIQPHENPRSKGPRQAAHGKVKGVHGKARSRTYTSLEGRSNGKEEEIQGWRRKPAWFGMNRTGSAGF
jgi:hypothetical protein